MVAVYRKCKWHINGPHVNIVIFDIILKAAEPLVAVFLICSFYWSLGSTQISRIYILVFWGTVLQLVIRTVDAKSAVAWHHCLVKCISWYFSGANAVLYWFAHAVQQLWAAFSCWQFFVAESPQIIRFVLSTKPNPNVPLSGLWNFSKSSDIKKRNRIGDKGDFWGMPVCVWIQLLSYFVNLMRVLCAVRKLFTKSVNHFGKPFLFRI